MSIFRAVLLFLKTSNNNNTIFREKNVHKKGKYTSVKDLLQIHVLGRAETASYSQGRIQPVSLGRGAILVIFGNLISLTRLYCKRDEVHFTTLL